MIQKQDRKTSKLGFKPIWNKDYDLPQEIKFHLTDNILGWGSYYVDTLMENAEEFLNGNRILCTDGGSNTCILNILVLIL